MLAALILYACTSDIAIVTKECNTVYYPDSDGDGYGDDDNGAELCETEGYTTVGGDCDDGDGAINPDASEVCDGEDNNCDGLADDADPALDTFTQTTWYLDEDQDSYGDEDAWIAACDAPEGYADQAADCDDVDGAINPDASEVCDGLDNDCDGLSDDADDSLDISTQDTWYDDLDGDTYGDLSSATRSCEQPAGTIADATDCDDTTAAANPAASEVCDGLDNDCDDAIDDADDSLDTSTATTWSADLDEDSYGDAAEQVLSCEAPLHYIETAGDCDGADGAVHPAASEVCDGVDNDCDGLIDDDDSSLDPSTASTWYIDVDGDSYGTDDVTWTSCEAPSSRFVADDTDCDDSDADVHPGITYYADADSDGYGDADTTSVSCDAPSGYTLDDSDCADSDGEIHPGADEVCDAQDNDCDGDTDESSATDAQTWYADSDKDGYGDPDLTKVACEQPGGYTDDTTDCDDTDRSVHPDAYETCDDVDQDCDGEVDEDALDMYRVYADTDSDGYGDPLAWVDTCEDAVSGHVGNANDCNDGTHLSAPDLTEVCDNIDNDCDGYVDEVEAADVGTWYVDRDKDGYGDEDVTEVSCDQPSGYVEDGGDCDDLEEDANPGETEVCDEIDNDCDGDVDESSASDASTWYDDLDEDGYGDPDASTVACDAPAGALADDSDCDDTANTIYPGAPERCDGVDQDCDGEIDEVFYSADFTSDVDDDVFHLNGDATVDTSSGVLLLTSGTDDQEGLGMLVDPIYADDLYVSFTFEISGGDGTSGGDGVNFFVADQDTDLDTIKKNDGSSLAVKGMTGWGWSVDTYGNGGTYGDAARMWTLYDGGARASASLSQMQGTGEHTFELWFIDGTYEVDIDGSSKITGTLSDWEDDLYRVGVSAATGAWNNQQVIDDLVISCTD